MIKTWSRASGRNEEEALNLRIFLKYNLVSFGDQLEMGEEMKEESKMTSNGDITHSFITHLFHISGFTQAAPGR